MAHPPRSEPSRGDPARGGAPAEVLQGSVELVTFHSPESRYTVLRLAPERGFDDPASPGMFRAVRVTAVGPLDQPRPGQRLRLHGNWTTHRTHGRQFAFEHGEVLAPVDPEGVVLYLASEGFEGIGETLARRIVERLGTSALEVIRREPERLEGIPGLKARVREKLVATVRAESVLHELHAFLRGAGLGARQAAAVVRRFGPEGEALLRRDPYQLAGAVAGIGFGIADRIARNLGFAEDGPERLRAGLLHTLREAAGEGHSLLPGPRLFEETRELLAVQASDATLQAALEALEQGGEVLIERPPEPVGEAARVYLPWLAHSERGLAANLARHARAHATPLADPTRLARAEALAGLTLDDDQRAAVLGLLAHPLALLTGGPGVGKTTIVRLLVAIAESSGARVLLASPTGRAAKRLSEATGRPAGTLHRTLAFDPQTGRFARDQEHPLEADLLVVDEISMLDVVLAHHLFKAVHPDTRVLLVGDPDQLPSVAPGNVLHDLIASQQIPCYRLGRIHRQKGGSRIVRNAHRILRGQLPELPPRGDLASDFYFFPVEEARACADLVVEVVTQRIPRSFGLAWVDDVQVLAPMYRGECGVDLLNERLRAQLGAGGDELRVGAGVWRVGERVIHTRNDYERELFNGDVGRVLRAGPEGLLVAYPEQEVTYDLQELSDLQPAFAITVHRSQGSEYPAVVVPLTTQHAVMLQRNLLYTAVTRARRLLVLVGSPRALQIAIDTADQGQRLSGLAERLRGPAAGGTWPP